MAKFVKFVLVAVLLSVVLSACGTPAEAATKVTDAFVGQDVQKDVKAATLEGQNTGWDQREQAAAIQAPLPGSSQPGASA